MTSFEMLGNPTVKPTKEEEKMKILARRSISALKDIEIGEIFTYENLGIRRPGNGLKPIEIEKIIGTKAIKIIIKGHIIQKDDYSDG